MTDEELKATRENARKECTFWMSKLRELDKERAKVKAAHSKWKAEFERCDRELAEKHVKHLPFGQGRRKGTRTQAPLTLEQIKEVAKALGIEV